MTTLSQLADHAERIGVIGSPSSTSEIALDILASAVTKKLRGELALFQFLQDNLDHFALGQITEISLRNVWHEDPTMRSLIRQRGKVDAISERQDTHQGEMIISAVFSSDDQKYLPSILGTVPATGTLVKLADDRLLDEILRPYKQDIFYLGHVYGSSPKLPLWFKHFGKGQGGVGEAYHLGIFGKTGSGKSVLAKTILLAYARHKNMGLFVFDPQGEFAKGLKDGRKPTSMGEILCQDTLKAMGRNYRVYTLSDFSLNTYELLGQLLLERGFFEELGIKRSSYQETAMEYAIDFLDKQDKIKLNNLDNQAFLDMLDELSTNVDKIYTGSVKKIQQTIGEIVSNIESETGKTSRAEKIWNEIIELFKTKGKKSIWEIVEDALKTNVNGSRPLIVIDLSQKPNDMSEAVWNDKIKPLLIDIFLNTLERQGEKYYRNDNSLNTLVVLDEASRLAPAGNLKNERLERVKVRLVDAVRTTRKYGLGWMFISQTLSSLDSEIVQQLRISFYGFGLSMGAEFTKLRELVGNQGNYLKLYRDFRDPQSSYGGKSEYSFMTIGPVSPLSFSGTPLFFNAFNDPDSFMSTNFSYQ